jgi:hypothetical protein
MQKQSMFSCLKMGSGMDHKIQDRNLLVDSGRFAIASRVSVQGRSTTL